MSRKVANTFIGFFALSITISTTTAQDTGREASHQEIESKGQDLSNATTQYRWVETRTETKDRKVETQILETPSIEGEYEPFFESEEETIQVNSQTTRVIRRLFARDPDGRRKVIEILEEEQRNQPGGGISVTRTVSSPDLNGRFQVIRREIQETVPVNSHLQQTRTTVLLPDINGGFAASEQIHKTERREDVGTVEIETTHLLPAANGRWEPYQKKVLVIQCQTNKVRTEEEHTYRRDANGKLSLSERTVSKQWKDAEGKEHQTVETYSRNIAGVIRNGDDRLDLVQRTRTVRSTRSDGSQVVVQELERRPVLAPADGLRVVERVVEIAEPKGQGIEKLREVQALDGSGRLRKRFLLKTRESEP